MHIHPKSQQTHKRQKKPRKTNNHTKNSKNQENPEIHYPLHRKTVKKQSFSTKLNQHLK